MRRILLAMSLLLLITVEAWAAPFFLLNGGGNGAADSGSIGIEFGGTRVIMNKYPLSAELSSTFDFAEIPSDAPFNVNRFDEPYLTRKLHHGPEIGFLFKSGYNLDEWVKDLTLQFGAGYSLQSTVKVSTGLVTGRHWQEGERYTEVYPVGYGGLLYRLHNLAFTVGYNNRRGVVGGVGTSW